MKIHTPHISLLNTELIYQPAGAGLGVSLTTGGGAAFSLGASTGWTSLKAGVSAGAAATGAGSVLAGRGFNVGAGPPSYFALFY